jgi:multidrug efflux pump
VGFAIVAMTMTLVAVYAPLAFAPGRTGRLFTEFALALAGAVVVSGLVALTLSPMLCRCCCATTRKPDLFRLAAWNAVLDWITRGYCRLLLVFGAAVRWLLLLMAIGSGLVSWSALGDLKRELSPLEDRGVVLAQHQRPDGATLDYTNRYAKSIERIGRRLPGVRPDLLHHRQPDSGAGQHLLQGHTLGRSQTHHAGDGRAK